MSDLRYPRVQSPLSGRGTIADPIKVNANGIDSSLLAATGITPGTYTSLTIGADGRAIAGTNPGVGGGGLTETFATIAADGVGPANIYVHYAGATAPIFSALGTAGNYRLTIPTGVLIRGIRIDSTGYVASGSGSLVLIIRDTDGKTIDLNLRCHDKSVGDEYGISDGVRIRRTTPTAGDASFEIPNVSLFPGGYNIFGTSI